MRFIHLVTLFLLVPLAILRARPDLPPIDIPPTKVMRGNSEIAQLLNTWYAAGTAAGNIGDYYDNRDGNHSRIKVTDYLQLSEIKYTEAQKKSKADWGAQKAILPNVVVGNSSTSSSVWSLGSMARMLYGTQHKGLQLLKHQYHGNNLYIYPEHRDHDPGSGGFPGHGDLYMANSPYLLISQGSSGSDKKFLHACLQTLAAFKPQVKQELIRSGTLMPTLQAVLRKSYQQVTTPSAYLSGAAHPTVFNGDNLDAYKMIHRAQAMERDTIPPVVQLHVVQEDLSDHQQTYLDAKRSEIHANTTAAIARIFRRSAASMTIIVSAEQSKDIAGRPLTYHWVVLRGDPQSIHIKERLGGAIAEITVPYPARSPIAPASYMSSNRIDIGVFVSIDKNYSAPAFVSFFGLDNERRIYDNFGRLYSIAYNAKRQLNLPGPHDISRWHRLMRLFLFERTSDTQRIQLLFPTLANSQIRFISEQASLLASHYGRYLTTQKKLKVALDKDEEKTLKQQRTAIQQAYMAELNKIDPKTQQPIAMLLREALLETTLNPHFYLQNKQPIDDFLALSNPAHRELFEAALKSMTEYGYFDRSTSLLSDTTYRLPVDFPHNPTFSNSRYQDFHAAVISTALVPHLFPPPKRGNCVDPRLTQPKPFRDVLHYESTGSLTGWTRYGPSGKEQFMQQSYTD